MASPIAATQASSVLTEHERREVDRLNNGLFQVYHAEADRMVRDDVLRQYVELKLRIVNRGLRFGIINNRIFAGSGSMVIPYLLDNTLLICHVMASGDSVLTTHAVRDGAIITDEFIESRIAFEGRVVDLESELFELDMARSRAIRIGHIRDMASQLERMAQSANLGDVTYLLRTLVAQTSLLSFKQYLRAKNLQIEVKRLHDKLLEFLDSPLSYRQPFLVRLLVRNISSVVSKPKLIDRLWNDSIDLAEIHLRGSQIVNEIRRSTHHAIGKRTLRIVQGYQDYLDTGNETGLLREGCQSPGPVDQEARRNEEAKKVLARIAEDLEELLGSTDVLSRIDDWCIPYANVLTRCESDKTLDDEVERVVASGIRAKNRWMYYHHLRMIRKRVSQFQSLPAARSAEEQLVQLLRLEPDKPGVDLAAAEADLRRCILDFMSEVRAAYQEPLFTALEGINAAFERREYYDSFISVSELRRQFRGSLIEKAFPEQRLLLYELDCLLEEAGFLCMRHIASNYDDEGVDLPQCLEIIRRCAMNLSHDGLHSRQLLDLADMLSDSSLTHAELTNVLEQVRRNYQHILRQLVIPFERLEERLKLDEKELRTALANMQRFLHDLSSMASFADTALTHIKQEVAAGRGDETTLRSADDQTTNDVVVHLSDKETIQRLVNSTDPQHNVRTLYGGKGSGLIYISYLNIPTSDGFILPTTYARRRVREKRDEFLDEIIDRHLRRLADDTSKGFGDPQCPLLLAVRGGSVFSMPGILSTVLFVGMNDAIAEEMARSDPWHAYDSYRRFLSSYAQAVWELDLEPYDLVDKAKTRQKVKYKEALPWQSMRDVVEETKEILRKEGHGSALDQILKDPFQQLTSAVRAVMDSWDHATARRYRDLKSICDSWNTAVVVQEMSSGNHRNEDTHRGMDERMASLTGVIPRTSVSEWGDRECVGEFKFSACGEDLVGGLTTSHSFQPLSELKSFMPMLDRRIHHKLARLRSFMGTDQEIEFTVDRGVLSVLQSRAAEIGANQQSYAFHEPGEPLVRGLGIRGSAFRGLVAFDQEDYNELSATDTGSRDDVDGILMLLENPSPADIPMVLMAEGLLAAKGGSTSHAAVAINGIEHKDYTAVMGAGGLSVDADNHVAVVTDGDGNTVATIRPGDVVSIHGGNGMVFLGSKQITRDGK